VGSPKSASRRPEGSGTGDAPRAGAGQFKEARRVTGPLSVHGYLILFGVILLDCLGLPVAGELFLVGVGVGVRAGLVDPVAGLVISVLAAVAGHSAAYWMGRLAGDHARRAPDRATPGWVGLLFSRFLVGVRVVLSPLAGLRRMPFTTFLLLDCAGATLWVLTFALVGYLGGLYLETARAILTAAASLVPLAAAAVAAAFLTIRLSRRARLRARA
jgi:membrane protein DedA with SNARE-associated domain